MLLAVNEFVRTFYGHLITLPPGVELFELVINCDDCGVGNFGGSGSLAVGRLALDVAIGTTISRDSFATSTLVD